MLHNLENQHQAQESNNQDGLLTQLQPGKERMNTLLKIIETLETKPSPSFQDESDIINMRKEIVQITEDQKRIMEEFDKKYIVSNDIVWDETSTGGNIKKDIGQAGEGKYFRPGK
jgi:uncharacterized protein YecA (UPF0149 family)